jgi:exonuclease V gamma subunit
VVAPHDLSLQSRLIGLEDVVVLEAVENPQEALRDFADAYCEGLNLPLPLFRRASPGYVRKQGSDIARLEAAYKLYTGNDFSTGDSGDAWIRLLWRDSNPCDERFAQWADRLYGPLLNELGKLRNS